MALLLALLAVLVVPVQCSNRVGCVGRSSAINLQHALLRPHCRSVWHYSWPCWLSWLFPCSAPIVLAVLVVPVQSVCGVVRSDLTVVRCRWPISYDADIAVSSFPIDHPKLLLFVLIFTSAISHGFQVTISRGLFAYELEYLNYFLGFCNMGLLVALLLLVGVLSHT